MKKIRRFFTTEITEPTEEERNSYFFSSSVISVISVVKNLKLLNLTVLGICFTFVLLCGCSTGLISMQENKAAKTNVVLDELRLELADVKHALHSTKVELQILDEKLKNQPKTPPKADFSGGQIALLEKRLLALEKIQEKAASDLRQLATHANQTSTSLVQYRDKINDVEQRLEEVGKLKTTLTSLSSAIQKKAPSEAGPRTYKVKSGDSLEKIARSERISVEALKKINDLDNDRIVIGQEIKIP